MRHRSIRLLRTLAVVLVATLPAIAQRQLQKVAASNAASGDNFGCATAIDGDWAIIGALYNSDRANQAGSAYVFHRANGLWSQTQELLASDGASVDQFGCAVSMSGSFAVIGAFFNAPSGGSRTGSAYVFELVGQQWIERSKLVASNASSGAQFGRVVAISGDRIVVGAAFAPAVGLHSGQAYVFERFGSSWLQVASLVGSDEVGGDAFGFSVAIDSDWLAVCSPNAKISPAIRPGAVYVFSRNAQGSWIEQQKLMGSNPAHQDLFGEWLGISAGRLIVGAGGRDGFRGSAYYFERSGPSWVERQEITAPTRAAGKLFSAAPMSASLAIGVDREDPDCGDGSGRCYVLSQAGSSWIHIGEFVTNDASWGDSGGRASLSGTTLLWGAPGDGDACPPSSPDCSSGSAYFVELAPTAIQYGSCLAGSPCSNDDNHGGCRNSTGQGAILQASGSGSCTTDDLVMEVRHLPPFAPGLIFMGGAQTTTPFGSGQLVVADDGKGIYRIEIHFADADGAFVHGPGNVALTQGIPNPLGRIQAGQTWNYQCWYRDQQGPCGAGFNLTNGLQVSYVP